MADDGEPPDGGSYGFVFRSDHVDLGPKVKGAEETG